MIDEEDVQAHLCALPAPEMPEQVRASVAHALDQEALVVPLTSATQRRRMTTLLVAASAAGVLALLGLSSNSPRSAVEPPAPVVRAGAIFEPASFGAELRERFLHAPRTTARTDSFADSPAGVSACTRSVEAFGRLRAIDAGRYGQVAAVVLITAYPANSDYEEVWVVRPTCGQSDEVVIRHMLFDVDNSTATLAG